MQKYQMYLASQSPRRKELIQHLGPNVLFQPSGVDETSEIDDPVKRVTDLAQRKGHHVYKDLMEKRAEGDPLPFVVAADTLVYMSGRFFGCPQSTKEARVMLTHLSGRVHQVYTGVYLGYNSRDNRGYFEVKFACATDVQFLTLTDDVLEHYLGTGDSMDKAGAYGVQGPAQVFISHLKGSYSNVVGLPLSELGQRIKKVLGYEEDESNAWRECFV